MDAATCGPSGVLRRPGSLSAVSPPCRMNGCEGRFTATCRSASSNTAAQIEACAWATHGPQAESTQRNQQSLASTQPQSPSKNTAPGRPFSAPPTFQAGHEDRPYLLPAPRSRRRTPKMTFVVYIETAMSEKSNAQISISIVLSNPDILPTEKM